MLNENVDAAESCKRMGRDFLDTVCCADVGFYEKIAMVKVGRGRSCSSENGRARAPKATDDRLTDTLPTASDKRAFSGKFAGDHGQPISSASIFALAILKRKSNSIGLPSKLPATCAVTTVPSSTFLMSVGSILA